MENDIENNGTMDLQIKAADILIIKGGTQIMNQKNDFESCLILNLQKGCDN